MLNRKPNPFVLLFSAECPDSGSLALDLDSLPSPGEEEAAATEQEHHHHDD